MTASSREKIVTKYGNHYKFVESGNDSVTVFRCPAVGAEMAFEDEITGVVVSHPEGALGWAYLPNTHPERFHKFKSVEEGLAWCATHPDKFSPAFGQLPTNRTDAQARADAF